MYIRTNEPWGFAVPQTDQSKLQPYEAPIKNGGQFITEGDADKVLTIISGPSPYQSYIKAVMATPAFAKLPKNFLRIVGSTHAVPQQLRSRFGSVDDKIVGGTIDRANGTLYLVAPPGRRNDTRLEYALHEAIHLLAHPFMTLVDEATFRTKYGPSCRPEPTVGTFQRKFCFGLGEGATQLITEQIMAKQNIKKFIGDSPYKDFIPPTLELIKIFSPDKFASAYFLGAVKEFTDAVEARWGNGCRNVANMTGAGARDRALNYIDQLERVFIGRRGPKGDYPTLLRTKQFA